MEEFKKKGYYPPRGRAQTSSAGSITYVNTNSGLTAGNVQDAIDEVDGRVDKLENKFELIEEITLEEDVVTIERTQTPDGKDYNLNAVVIKFYSKASTATGSVYVRINELITNLAFINNFITADDRVSLVNIDVSKGLIISNWTNPVATDITTVSINTRVFIPELISDNITKLIISSNSSSAPFVAGTSIKIYGVWA